MKSIKENIKVSSALLSRFDLIFLLLDSPDPNRDYKLSEHIMKVNNLSALINISFMAKSRKEPIRSFNKTKCRSVNTLRSMRITSNIQVSAKN